RQGYTPVPRGTGFVRDMLSRTAHSISLKTVEHYMPVTENIIAVEGIGPLKVDGFDAHVIPLGAHTAGSIGLRIGEHFFAGDTLFSVIGDLYPMFADRIDELPSVWETILGSGAKYIYPGHGRMIERQRLESEYNKRYGHLKNAQ
ncbi:MAG: MBL fold metallo-hydrolase, partial [Eubacteriales bacterium]|nr:MBL fold metallo-hydrolase [Eubacteriales bacterium]